MPKKFPPEFKRDVVAVARRGVLFVNEVASDLDISPESARRWMRQTDVDDGVKDGLTTAEQSELAQLRRKTGRLEMENEIVRRAAADSDGQCNTVPLALSALRSRTREVCVFELSACWM